MLSIANEYEPDDSTAISFSLTTSRQASANVLRMDTQANRLANLKQLLLKFKNQREMADKGRLVAPHLSQMLNGHRKIGEAVARRLEKELRLTPGWMDEPHPEGEYEKIKPLGSDEDTPDEPHKRDYESGRMGISEYIKSIEESTEIEICEMLIHDMHVDYESVRMNVRTFTEYGTNSFDIEVDTDRIHLYCDVFLLKDTHGGASPKIDRIMSQAMRARLANSKYCLVCVIDDMNSPAYNRLRMAIDTLHNNGFLAGSVFVTDTTEDREKIELMFKVALNT